MEADSVGLGDSYLFVRYCLKEETQTLPHMTLVALFLSPFASSKPDGLERVAEDKGFLEKGEGRPILLSLIPDYTFP